MNLKNLLEKCLLFYNGTKNDAEEKEFASCLVKLFSLLHDTNHPTKLSDLENFPASFLNDILSSWALDMVETMRETLEDNFQVDEEAQDFINASGLFVEAADLFNPEDDSNE